MRERCRRLPGLGQDRAEPGLKVLQCFGEAVRDAQPLPPALHDKLGRARLSRGRFDDAVSRCFMRVAKNGEQRHPVAMVDRVIAPHAASNMPTVEAEKLVKLMAGEIQRSVL